MSCLPFIVMLVALTKDVDLTISNLLDGRTTFESAAENADDNAAHSSASVTVSAVCLVTRS